MRIVVGTDFSSHAKEAATAAGSLARRMGASLKLVHVADLGAARLLGDTHLKTAREAVKELLQIETSRLSGLGIQVEPELLEGLPDEALISYAERAKADLVVIAALGMRPPSRWRLGSVAERAARMSPIPTLVVRAAEPFVAWAKGERPLKIVVADDRSEAAKQAIAWAAELKNLAPIQLIVGHVYEEGEEAQRYGLRPTAERAATLETMLRRELHDRVAPMIGGEPKVRLVPQHDKVGASVVRLAAEERADLLVVAPHHHGLGRLWHGSVSQAALHLSPMNVATLPVEEEEAKVEERIPSMGTVLVTTDLSPAGNRAIPYAYSLLPKGGKVHLLHVLQLVIPVVYGEEWPGGLLAPSGLKNEEGAIKKQLEALVPRGAAERGVETVVEVISTINAVEAICQTAERVNADVICMGSHGRTGLTRAVVGSITQAVLGQSRRPVLVIRPSERA